MTLGSLEDLLLSDPLSEVARKERRFLLGTSLVGITLAKTGLIPTRISALGVECTNADRNGLLWVLACVILYALLAFLLYAVSDFMAWQVSRRLARRKDFVNREDFKKVVKDVIEREFADDEDYRHVNTEQIQSILEDEVKRKVETMYPTHDNPTALSAVGWLRAGFDFFLPMLIGAYAIYCLWALRFPSAPIV